MTVQIEKTAKHFKATMVVGVAILCVGLIVAMAGAGALGGAMMFAGFAFYVVGRMLAWWYHG